MARTIFVCLFFAATLSGFGQQHVAVALPKQQQLDPMQWLNKYRQQVEPVKVVIDELPEISDACAKAVGALSQGMEHAYAGDPGLRAQKWMLVVRLDGQQTLRVHGVRFMTIRHMSPVKGQVVAMDFLVVLYFVQKVGIGDDPSVAIKEIIRQMKPAPPAKSPIG